MTRRQLMQNIDSEELRGWMAYYRIEPFGHRMDHWMIASLMAMTANLQTGRKGKKHLPDDFLPKMRKKQSWQDMKSILMEAFGAPDKT